MNNVQQRMNKMLSKERYLNKLFEELGYKRDKGKEEPDNYQNLWRSLKLSSKH